MSAYAANAPSPATSAMNAHGGRPREVTVRAALRLDAPLPSPRAVGAHAHDVDPVALWREHPHGHLRHHRAHDPLDPDVGGHVANQTARRADQVMVVLREGLGQLVAGEVLARDDPVDQAGLLEDREVAIHRAHREALAALQDLVDGQRVPGGAQDLKQRAASGSEPLAKRSKSRRDDSVHLRRIRSTWPTRHVDSSGPRIPTWSAGPAG